MKGPYASLSLDLDDKWTYMKTHGDSEWVTFPSYLEIAIPRILDILNKFDLKVTFFIVGQDAATEKNKEFLKHIAKAGHDIGNHTFHHDPWLHLYSEQEIDSEISKAEQAIENATSIKTIGFRGPGFSLSETTLNVLHRRDYLYDATKLPTFIAPLARAYFLSTAKFDKHEKLKRKSLFGGFRDGFSANEPYQWQLQDGGLLEIPVTTMPFFKIPIHISYILYLSVYSPILALIYFKFALSLCRINHIQPSILLHPLDFLGCDDFDELSFFPAMKLYRQKKIDLVETLLQLLSSHFKIITMHQHAQEFFDSKN